MLSQLQELIADICSFTPVSTLAGEIWMDQSSTPATVVSASANLQSLLILTDVFLLFYVSSAGQHFASCESAACKCCPAGPAETREPNSVKGFSHSRFHRSLI